MIANRFQSFRRLVIGTVAAMGLYMVTSQVAAERTELERIERTILATQKDIRQLQTELGTRANLRQLERWNGDVLALTTPDADQFVANEVALAGLDRSGVVAGPRYAPAAMVTAMVAQPAGPAPETRSDAVAPPAMPARRALIAESRGGETRLAALSPKRRAIDTLEARLLDDRLVGELASVALVEGRRSR